MRGSVRGHTYTTISYIYYCYYYEISTSVHSCQARIISHPSTRVTWPESPIPGVSHTTDVTHLIPSTVSTHSSCRSVRRSIDRSINKYTRMYTLYTTRSIITSGTKAREVCIPSVRAAARITADIVPDSRTVAYGHGFPSPIQPTGFSNNTIYRPYALSWGTRYTGREGEGEGEGERWFFACHAVSHR